MRRDAIPLLLLALLAAGCAGPAQDSALSGDALLAGGLTAAATPSDLADMERLVAEKGGRTLLMQSHPMQFQVQGLDAGACEEVRAALRGKPYVASVGGCQPAAGAGEPARPTGSGGDGGRA